MGLETYACKGQIAKSDENLQRFGPRRTKRLKLPMRFCQAEFAACAIRILLSFTLGVFVSFHIPPSGCFPRCLAVGVDARTRRAAGREEKQNVAQVLAPFRISWRSGRTCNPQGLQAFGHSWAAPLGRKDRLEKTQRRKSGEATGHGRLGMIGCIHVASFL